MDLMDGEGDQDSSSSSSSNSNFLHYEATVIYCIEEIRPRGGIKKFWSAAYSNFASLEEFQEEFKDINQEEQIARLHKIWPHTFSGVMNEGMAIFQCIKISTNMEKQLEWCNEATFYTRSINFRYCFCL